MNGRKGAVLLACFATVVGIGQTGVVGEYIQEARQQPAAVSAWGPKLNDLQKDPLYKQILEKREQTRIQPVDAVLDRVWKAIPGYNGLEIDAEETYKQAKAAGSSTPITYVYRQIPPKVNLEDLGAEPIYRGNPKKPMVALMINVAWGNEFIVPMLDILDAEKVKATFFFDGSWLKKNPELAKEIQKRGHELENHAYTHPNMSQLSEYRASMEISKTQKLLKESLGVDNTWFAPPSGDFNQQTVRIAHGLGLKTVLWTLDTVDWRNPSPESVVNKISNKVEAGTLILMHPTASSSKALPGMIRAIKKKGLIPGTVGQTLSPARVIPPSG
ncbi:polysaccharide deacetylase family protein [Paenibacillus sp. HJL G12]|uniref:Polysaccharide deacetylase family protein n=1 Tax=Paenibacillus dendrobii TaxID=2691084 RepID=A0A7X3IH84_9BACL|nr:polysaccharide deacetylase family protein [Paenibacillus dendrobii]MWV43498.1 polysaccharide deacetylase family protein [Paenibacillus dendrobii]